MRLRASRAEGSWNWKPDQPGKQLEDHRDLGRIGIRGAVLVKAACAGLLARDSALLADGAPARLRPPGRSAQDGDGRRGDRRRYRSAAAARPDPAGPTLSARTSVAIELD